MPIAIKCKCGKALSVKDELAGKAIKCPGCGQPVRVPGDPAVAKPAATSSSSSMDDLFAEEGLDRQVASVCPTCRAEMSATAVLCMKCGYNRQTGEYMAGHKVPGVDIDAGTMALNKADDDMKKAAQAQKEMLGKSGMPPWMLALVLFILGSATGIAVLAVNATRREEAIEFSPMRLFLNLGGAAFAMVAIGALVSLIIMAFRTEMKKGFLSLTILYLFPFAFKTRNMKPLIVAILCGVVSGLFFAGASKY